MPPDVFGNSIARLGSVPFLVRWTALILFAPSIFAQLPTPRLTTIFPPGGRLGTNVEVILAGDNLDEAVRLVFSNTNLTSKPKLDSKGKPEANKFVVTIPDTVSPGVCDARVAGRFGLSNARAFAIGDLPESQVPSMEFSAATSFEVPLNSVVNGRLSPVFPVWFKFKAKQGQRVIMDCQTVELDFRTEDVLVISDTSGRELARNHRGGPLDFTTPNDGEFRLKLHDSTFRGGEEYFYRLTISTRPWIDFIHPSSGLPASKSKYTVYGRNLPGGAPAKDLVLGGKLLEKIEVEIELPSDVTSMQRGGMSALIGANEAALDVVEYRLNGPQGVSNPTRFGVAAAPVVAESLDAPPETQGLVPPCEFSGRFRARGRPVILTFDAKKGDVWWLEVISQRLGTPTAPSMLVERITKKDKSEESVSLVSEVNGTDANVGGQDFNTISRDPIYRFEAKEDGLYRLQVRDLFNRNPGDTRYPFRLIVRKETPDFRLVALAMQPPKPNENVRIASPLTPNLRRGETQVIKVLALRRDGFNGEIRLTTEGLPDGVSCAGARIPEGKPSTLLAFTAKEDMASWYGAVRIVGRAKLGETEVTREARGGSVVWQVPDFNEETVYARVTRDVSIGITGSEAAAITIEPVEDKVVEAMEGMKIQIPLKITRRDEFNDALKLKAVGVTALDALGELEVKAKTNSVTLEIDLGKFKLTPGLHSFILQAQTTGKYRSYVAEAKAAVDALKLAEKEVGEATAEAKKSAEDKKAAAQKTAKEFGDKSNPKDATIMVYSAPIRLLIKAEEKK